MNEAAFLIGFILGGMLPILLLSLLVGRVFFKNMGAGRKILLSTAIAYVVVVLLGGFFVEYFISSLLLIGLRFAINAERKRKDAEEDKETTDD